MSIPRLTFFCELDQAALPALFADPSVIANLQVLNARLSLGLLDFSPERATVVHQLNQAGVPVVAWLLLPPEHGYWFNMDNAHQALECYQNFKAWTLEHQLMWAGVGLDIEPDLRDLQGLRSVWWRVAPRWLVRGLKVRRFNTARAAYRSLVAQIHADGFPVEAYQFCLIADERVMGSTFLQRTTGIVDIAVDREVWMLYTSFIRPNGPGMLGSYGVEAQAIGLGSTGGGVEIAADIPPLSWDELARDLRLAWNNCNDLYIYSLEGCVRQGFLVQLKGFAWDQPIILPEDSIVRVEGWRHGLQSVLWLMAHLYLVGLAILGALGVIFGLRRFLRQRSTGIAE